MSAPAVKCGGGKALRELHGGFALHFRARDSPSRPRAKLSLPNLWLAVLCCAVNKMARPAARAVGSVHSLAQKQLAALRESTNTRAVLFDAVGTLVNQPMLPFILKRHGA